MAVVVWVAVDSAMKATLLVYSPNLEVGHSRVVGSEEGALVEEDLEGEASVDEVVGVDLSTSNMEDLRHTVSKLTVTTHALLISFLSM